MFSSYIKNRRRLDRSISNYSFVFWIINLIFAEVSINMLLKIVTSSREKWFDEAVLQELREDTLFADRTEMVIWTVIVIMTAIIIFSVTTVVLFRNIQLKNMLTQMGVLVTLGYDRNHMYRFCMMEPVADIVVAFPMSVVVSILVWMAMSKTKVVTTLYIFMNNHFILDIVAYIVCGVVMILVVMIHTKYFISVSMKKGIRYMLGKGI